MQTHIQIAGIMLILLSLIHFYFPQYFNWKKDLAATSLINRQMMYIHTFFIALVVFMMGVLCLTSATELAGTPLGKKISLGIGIFWIIRLLVQFFGYSPRLWKGKAFETSMHITFTAIWMYFSFVFIGTYVMR